MHPHAKKEFTAFAAIAFGLLFMLLLQLSGRIFAHEGLITLWIRASLGPVTLPSPPPPEPERILDTTRPVAIMVDNHPNARPQSGVSKADVVWEAPVEGSLTRNMLIFRSASTTEIGPVRSARPYFLKWAREFDAVYTHVGGSTDALQQLASGTTGLDDANEFSNGAAFWRDSRRNAPHNTYTSSARLWELIRKKEWSTTTAAVDATARSREVATGTAATRLQIVPVQGAETIEFRFDEEENGYILWRRNRQIRDRDGSVIAPQTVVALEMDVLSVPDPQNLGLIGLETIGAGAATVFRDGLMLSGAWKKTSAADPTTVTDAQGQKIPFAEGQVWYVIVGANRGGSVAFE
ncbi:MAG: DUF3048 domain-containing protein [Patescibacteria group bacterium]|nr:MAG: DUF3048 domain-containing protein [Patescibacteria group bacterium]